MSDKSKGESEGWVINIKREWRLRDECKGEESKGWMMNIKERVKGGWWIYRREWRMSDEYILESEK